MTRNVILIAATSDYFNILIVFLRSLKKNWPHHPDVILYQQSFSSAQLEALKEYPRISPINMNEEDFAVGPSLMHKDTLKSKVFYSSLCVFTDKFKDYDKVLYLDVDTVILKPLDQLFEEDEFIIFQEAHPGEHQMFYYHNDPSLLALLTADGINSTPETSGNTGVLMVPKKDRTKQNYDECADIIKRYSKYLALCDQSVFNIWMLKHGIQHRKEYAYNFQIVQLMYQGPPLKEYGKAKIFHFNGLHSYAHHISSFQKAAFLSSRIPLAGKWIFFIFWKTFMKEYLFRNKYLEKIFCKLKHTNQLLHALLKKVRFFYYYKIYRKRILSSKPVTCGRSSDLEIHMITSEKDFLDAVWCLKTFYHYSETCPRLVIHEDGSLSAKGTQTFIKHFKNCRIIKRKDADEDLKRFLANHKLCREKRLHEKFYCAMKLFDIFYYASTEKLLYLDSDILFFNKPHEILKCIESNKPFFNSDYQNAYSMSVSELNNIFEENILPKINAGLMSLPKSFYVENIDFIERYFEKTENLPAPWDINRHEQTVNALLLSKYGAVRLNDNHQLAKQPITDKTISHHFVDDGSRANFYNVGLAHLKTNKFLKDFKRSSNLQANRTIKEYKPSEKELTDARQYNLYAGENHLGGYLISNKEFPCGDHLTWSPALWGWAYNELKVRSVLDIGCGEGHSTNFFRNLGCEVLGVDGSIQARKDSAIPEHHITHDFNDGPFIPLKTYDLIWSCEFVEHVEEQYIDNLLKTFSYADKYIMMTYAEPGQGGWHHVNCQNEEYWVNRLSQIGFKPDPRLTELARKTAQGGHFARNGLVLVKRT